MTRKRRRYGVDATKVTKIDGTKLVRTRPSRSLLETFLCLCQMTTPHEHESYCWPYLPMEQKKGWYKWIDGKNNVHIMSLDEGGARIMWSCHLDNACSTPDNVNFYRKGDVIKTDEMTILGADDKIGAAIMIKMIDEGVPGHYVFHVGEEGGAVGSKWYAEHMRKTYDKQNKPVACIALDRCGKGDAITHQGGKRTASDKWTKALCDILAGDQLKLAPCPHGLFTDSRSYADQIPECTNLSVGYGSHHTKYEFQDIGFAQRLLDALVTRWRDVWAIEPDRDPASVEHYVYVPPARTYQNHNTYQTYHNRPGSEDPGPKALPPPKGAKKDSTTSSTPTTSASSATSASACSQAPQTGTQSAQSAGESSGGVIDRTVTIRPGVDIRMGLALIRVGKLLKRYGNRIMTLVFMCPDCHILRSPPEDHDVSEAVPCEKCGVSMNPRVVPLLNWVEDEELINDPLGMFEKEVAK